MAEPNRKYYIPTAFNVASVIFAAEQGPWALPKVNLVVSGCFKTWRRQTGNSFFHLRSERRQRESNATFRWQFWHIWSIAGGLHTRFPVIDLKTCSFLLIITPFWWVMSYVYEPNTNWSRDEPKVPGNLNPYDSAGNEQHQHVVLMTILLLIVVAACPIVSVICLKIISTFSNEEDKPVCKLIPALRVETRLVITIIL